MNWEFMLVGVATAVSIHRMVEPGGINYKLSRLKKAIDSGVVETPPVKGIDSRAKAYGLGVGTVVILSSLGYLIASIIDISANSATYYALCVLLLSDFVSMVTIDKYHITIEKITKSFKK